MTEDNVGQLNDNLITMSYHSPNVVKVDESETMFTLRFIAERSGNLVDMIKLSSKVTASEAYIGDKMDVRTVTLSSATDQGEIFENKLYM